MKNIKIVNIRALAILLVVMGHSIILYSLNWDLYETTNKVLFLDYLKKIIDIIQMPLFFSVSGFLFYYSRNKIDNLFKFFKNKFHRLLVPYIFIALLWMVPIRLLVGYQGYSNMSISDIIYNAILLGKDCGHLWFLPTLFLIFLEMHIILYFMKKINSNNIIDFIILIIMICLSKYCFKIPNIIPFASRSIEYIIWFYLGYIINKYEDCMLILKKYKYLMYIFLILSILHWFYFEEYISILFTKILIILIIYIEVPSISNKYIELISENSFGIYLFHSPLIYITFSTIPNSNPILVIILNFLVFGIISLVLTLIMKKTEWRFIIGEK